MQGDHVLDLLPGERLEVTRELFGHYADLVRHEGEGSCEERVSALVAALAAAVVPDVMRELLDPVPLVELSRTWQLVPSATDANPKNLLVVDRRTPVAIDLGDLRLDPFFSFPVGFVELVRGDVLDAYLAGALDEQVDGLFTAAGAGWPEGDRPRETLLAVRIGLVSNRRAMINGEFDIPRFETSLADRWWRAVVAHSPPTFS